MERDEEGFDYPIVDTDRCIECHKCERVCPFMKLDEPRESQVSTQRVLPMKGFARRVRREDSLRY